MSDETARRGAAVVELHPGDRVRWWTGLGVWREAVVVTSAPDVTWVRWEAAGVDVTVMTGVLERLASGPTHRLPDTTCP